FVQLQGLHGVRPRFGEDLSGVGHAEKPEIKVRAGEVSGSLSVSGVQVNCLDEEPDALLQVQRSHLTSKIVSLQTSLVSLRVHLAGPLGARMFRVYQLVNLGGDALRYLGLQPQDVTQV